MTTIVTEHMTDILLSYLYSDAPPDHPVLWHMDFMGNFAAQWGRRNQDVAAAAAAACALPWACLPCAVFVPSVSEAAAFCPPVLGHHLLHAQRRPAQGTPRNGDCTPPWQMSALQVHPPYPPAAW